MRAPGFERAGDQRRAQPQMPQHPIVCHSLLPVLQVDGHLLPVHAVTADRTLDHAFGRAGRTPQHGLIDPFQIVGREQRGQPFVRGLMLGDHHHPAGILVEPVHNARPALAANAQQAVAAMMQQGVDQRTIRVTGRGVDHHPGGFVDDD